MISKPMKIIINQKRKWHLATTLFVTSFWQTMNPHKMWAHLESILMVDIIWQSKKWLRDHKLKFKPLFQLTFKKRKKTLFANSNREHYFFKSVTQVEKGPWIFFFLLKKLWLECLIWTLFFKDDNTFSSTFCEEITYLSLVFSICNACTNNF